MSKGARDFCAMMATCMGLLFVINGALTLAVANYFAYRAYVSEKAQLPR